MSLASISMLDTFEAHHIKITHHGNFLSLFSISRCLFIFMNFSSYLALIMSDKNCISREVSSLNLVLFSSIADQ